MYRFGQEVAEVLSLPEPHLYTGHTFCQSVATEAADHGFNSIEMKGHYSWKGDSTVMCYVNKSACGSKKVANILENKEELSSAQLFRGGSVLLGTFL